jgi:hypothetical protein
MGCVFKPLEAVGSSNALACRCRGNFRKSMALCWETRPGRFRPEPLAEPDRNLTIHPAPIKQTHQPMMACVLP